MNRGKHKGTKVWGRTTNIVKIVTLQVTKLYGEPTIKLEFKIKN